MHASAVVAVESDGRGSTRVVDLSSQAPLLLRQTAGDGPGVHVHLVGGAAGPLSGDRLDLRVDVGTGARLTVRSVAASLAQPGVTPGPSHSSTRVVVASGATLDWWPEPIISVRGSEHHASVTIEIADGATVRWVEEIRLGRDREIGGRLETRQRVIVGGVPIAAHDLAFAPDEVTPGEHGSATVAITGFVHGPPSLPSSALVRDELRVARFPLGPETTAWVGLGDRHEAVRRALADLGLDLGIALGDRLGEAVHA